MEKELLLRDSIASLKWWISRRQRKAGEKFEITLSHILPLMDKLSLPFDTYDMFLAICLLYPEELVRQWAKRVLSTSRDLHNHVYQARASIRKTEAWIQTRTEWHGTPLPGPPREFQVQ